MSDASVEIDTNVMPFGKHEGEQISDLPISYVKWCLDNLDLDTNPHKITMAFDVPGLGNLKFNFTDQTSEG